MSSFCCIINKNNSTKLVYRILLYEMNYKLRDVPKISNLYYSVQYTLYKILKERKSMIIISLTIIIRI